jgi:hypothetical protein
LEQVPRTKLIGDPGLPAVAMRQATGSIGLSTRNAGSG